MTLIYPNIVPENNLRLPDALTVKQSNVYPPSQTTLYEGSEEDYKEEIRIFAEARETTRRLGSKLSALSVDWPLAYTLRRVFGYDLNVGRKAAARLGVGMNAGMSTPGGTSPRLSLVRYMPSPQLLAPHRAPGD